MRLSVLGFRGVGDVLSVAKLTLGQEAYYEQQVAVGLDDYYAGRGESPGIWHGQGASGLGLAGVVEDGGLGTLLRGIDPATGDVLRAPVRERTITVRALDVESGEWRQEEKRLAPVSGYDLVFSCPKSVSILHALTEDERVRREISEAHDAAWQAALSYLENEACVVRRGHAGGVREYGGGFAAAAFRHRTSRAQDPHLHTHVIVANMAATNDGEWRALDGEAILRTYRLAAGYLYEAHLRHELTQRLGLEWAEPAKGMAELVKVPDAAIQAFSTRRRSLLDHMEAHGSDGFAAARVAALATREAKEQVDLPSLRAHWKARAAEHGLGRRELRRLGHEHAREAPTIDRDEMAQNMLGAEGLTAIQTTFTQPELVRVVAGSLRGGAAVQQVLDAAHEFSRLPGVEPVEPGDIPGRPARFTTRELLEIERGALTLAAAGRDAGAPAADGRTLLRMLGESDLAREQQLLVREASLSRDRVVCVVGVAGSGKTTAIETLSQICEASGITVMGAAPSGRAADELATATGVTSRTLHRLLLDAARDGGLPRGCVLVVDEAGMAETRTLAPVLELVERAESKAILVGDPSQLPAVGAGGLYQSLCADLGALELGGNRRQQDVAERRALARLRVGDPEPYLGYAARQGRLEVEDEASTAKQRLLEDWWQVAFDDRAGAVMIAYRRSDVAELNQAGHELMRRFGRLGDDSLTIGATEFRAGDRVLCRRNDPRLGVRNGTRATIVDLDRATLILRLDTGAPRSIPLAYARDHLHHGYALTGHAAQGATVDRAFVLLEGRGALQEWGYVAASRASIETRLYLTGAPRESDLLVADHEPGCAAAQTARALAESASEPLALAQMTEQPEITARLHARRQEDLEQLHTRAGEQLAAARRELAQLGWWHCRQRRAELRTEVAFREQALRQIVKERTELERRPSVVASLRRPTPGEYEVARKRSLTCGHSRQRTIERDPPSLRLEL
jgi:conjugative relaxase-like TrwC/TraI family protein